MLGFMPELEVEVEVELELELMPPEPPLMLPELALTSPEPDIAPLPLPLTLVLPLELVENRGASPLEHPAHAPMTSEEESRNQRNVRCMPTPPNLSDVRSSRADPSIKPVNENAIRSLRT